MELGLYWIYAFNVIVNSALVFFTSIFLVEFFGWAFGIKHPRARVFCRILPFLKICFDLCLYCPSKWALAQGVNPVLAEKGTRQLSILLNPFTEIGFSMESGQTFSLADIIALSLGPLWIRVIVCVALIGSLLAIVQYLRRIFRERRLVATMRAQAVFIPVEELSPSLGVWTRQKQIKVALSYAVSSPCVVGNTVFFPPLLFPKLSEREIEAIVVHETAHFLWKDASVRIACSLVACVFWWIPTKWWQRRVEDTQEQASDAAIYSLKIPGAVLAGALLKTAGEARRGKSQLTFSFVGGSASLKKRMEMLLKEAPRFHRWKLVQYGLLALAWASILFGRLWIF